MYALFLCLSGIKVNLKGKRCNLEDEDGGWSIHCIRNLPLESKTNLKGRGWKVKFHHTQGDCVNIISTMAKVVINVHTVCESFSKHLIFLFEE